MAEDWDPIAAVDPPAVEVKLFGKWNPDEVQVGDISLQVRGMIDATSRGRISRRR